MFYEKASFFCGGRSDFLLSCCHHDVAGQSGETPGSHGASSGFKVCSCRKCFCVLHYSLHLLSPSSRHTHYMLDLNKHDTLAVNSTDTLLLSVFFFPVSQCSSHVCMFMKQTLGFAPICHLSSMFYRPANEFTANCIFSFHPLRIALHAAPNN